MQLSEVEMQIDHPELYVSGSPRMTIRCTETGSTYTTNYYEHTLSVTWIRYIFTSPISLTRNYTYLITSIDGNYSV